MRQQWSQTAAAAYFLGGDPINHQKMTILVVEPIASIGPQEQGLIEQIKARKCPAILAINKIDRIHPDYLLEVMDDYRGALDFKDVFPISALQGNNCQEFIDTLIKDLPEGPQYYPTDQVTDHPERFIAGELIREKVLELTREEVPHSVAVVVDRIKRRDEEKILIQATIIVERASQKGIIIGKGGKMLKTIGVKARKDIELMMGDKVYLELWVKVMPNWKDRQIDLRSLGYKQDDY